MTSTYKGYLEYAQKLIDESNSVVPDEVLHQICGYGMLNSTYGITRLTDKKFLASAEDRQARYEGDSIENCAYPFRKR